MVKKAAFLAVCVLLPVLCLRSASRADWKQPCILVTRVEVVYTRPDATIRRIYTRPEKMASILNYLRILPYRGKPQTDPLGCPDGYDITLHYSNGKRRLFRQRGDRYLSKGENCWEQVDGDRARLLYPLLLLLPGDL